MLLRTNVLIIFSAAIGCAQGIPGYQARRTADEIVVDGRLTEFTWRVANRVGDFRNIREPDNRNVLPTQAALAWDDRNLYVMFVCEDPQPWSNMFERDMHLWEQEVVEVFLDPDGDGENYPELEVSPHNVVVDLLIPAPGRISADEAARWNIEGLKTAVGKDGAGWSVEIAIPWASLDEAGVRSAPRIGERWRVGLYRIERPGGLGEKPDDAQAELQAWSVTKRSFHEPWRFGVVEFVLR